MIEAGSGSATGGSLRRPVTVVAAGAAAGGAVLATGDPTGVPLVDGSLRAAFAVVVVIAATRARPWTLVLASAFAIVGADGGWLGLGVAGLAGAVWVALDRRAPPWVRPLVGAAAVQLLLRLDLARGFGAESLVAAAAVTPVLVSGYRHAARRTQRLARTAGLATIGLAVVAALGVAVAGIAARSSFQEAIRSGEAGVAALEAGDDRVAAAELARSASAFESAHAAVTTPWARPALAVPVLSQHVDAVATMAAASADVAASAATSLERVTYDELGPSDGRVDLARVRELAPYVTATRDALDRAVADTRSFREQGWLLAPVADRLGRVESDLEDKLETGRRTEGAVRVVPDLLGGAGDRRYLVLFATPAESRGLGGFAGAYGILTASDGRVELETSGRTVELPGPAGPLVGHDEFLARYGPMRPDLNLGNVTASPDVPTVAAVAAQLFPGGPFDGVLYVDPTALAALLSIAGPVEVPGLPFPLDATNARQFLLTDQYVAYPDVDERSDLLADVARATFERLTDADLPGPKAIIDALAPVVAEGRLRFVAFDAEVEPFLTEIGLATGFPRPDGRDLVALRTSNANPNKIDAFLHRTVDYAVDVDPAGGEVEATATVGLRNDAPATGLPGYVIGNRDLFGGGVPTTSPRPPGSNTVDLTWYTPYRVDDATVDGSPVPVSSTRELGWWAHTVRVVVPPEGSAVVRYALSGRTDALDPYRVTVAAQPLVNPDVIDVTVAGVPGVLERPDRASQRLPASSG